MISSWRREFSTRGASSPNFPFGVVSLHGWCGEEEANCNPGFPNAFGRLKSTPSRVATTDTANIRWSQQGANPTVPNPTLGDRTFIAMTYDLADGLWGLTTSPYGNCSSVGKKPVECFAPAPRGMGPSTCCSSRCWSLRCCSCAAASAAAAADDDSLPPQSTHATSYGLATASRCPCWLRSRTIPPAPSPTAARSSRDARSRARRRRTR